MKKILIHEDPNRLRMDAEKRQQQIEYLQNVLNEANSIEAFSITNIAELQKVVNQPHSILEELTKDIPTPKEGRWFKKREVVIKELELPDITNVSTAAAQPHPAIYDWTIFQIQKGKVVIPPQTEKELVDKAKMHTKTPEENEIVEAYQTACAAFSQLLYTLNQHGLRNNIHTAPTSYIHTEVRKIFICHQDKAENHQEFIKSLITDKRRRELN